MAQWEMFVDAAPHIAETFKRRHAATANLCLLATLRADGSPRISPMEPRIFQGRLLVVGMPGTTKFRDLERDPRFCLHTATVDPYVGDGDAKLWGFVENLQDEGLHARFADHLFEEAGLDLRGQEFDPFFVAEITSASALDLVNDKLTITIWKSGDTERVVEKA